MKSVMAWFKKKNKSTFEQYLEAIIIVLPIAFILRTFFFGLYVVPSGSMEETMLRGERFFADKLTPWFTPIKRGEIISLNDPTYEYSENKFVNMLERYIWAANWTKRVIGVPGDHVKGVIEDGVPAVYVNGAKLDEPYINKDPLIYVWRKSVPSVQDMYLNNCKHDVFSFDVKKSFADQPFYWIDPALVIHKLNSDGLERAYGATYDAALDCYFSYPKVPSIRGDDVFDVYLGDNEYWVMGDNRRGSYDSRGWGKLDGRLIHGRIKCRFFSIKYGSPWKFLCFDESWLPLDLVLHPIEFWQRIRWSRCFNWVS